MAKRRIVLTFPKDQVERPIIYRLSKDYDLVMNILRAQVMPKEVGRLVMELTGSREGINQGLKYLKESGVKVESMAQDIKLREEDCTHCGACTAVCPSGALSLDRTTWEVVFDRDKCLLCEHCLPACPYRVIESTF